MGPTNMSSPHRTEQANSSQNSKRLLGDWQNTSTNFQQKYQSPYSVRTELYDVNRKSPSDTDIAEAVNQLKNRKAEVEHSIPLKLKKCLMPLVSRLHGLLCPTRKRYTQATGVPPFPRTICKNYRGTSLININVRTFCPLLYSRFAAARDHHI